MDPYRMAVTDYHPEDETAPPIPLSNTTPGRNNSVFSSQHAEGMPSRISTPPPRTLSKSETISDFGSVHATQESEDPSGTLRFINMAGAGLLESVSSTTHPDGRVECSVVLSRERIQCPRCDRWAANKADYEAHTVKCCQENQHKISDFERDCGYLATNSYGIPRVHNSDIESCKYINRSDLTVVGHHPRTGETLFRFHHMFPQLVGDGQQVKKYWRLRRRKGCTDLHRRMSEDSDEFSGPRSIPHPVFRRKTRSSSMLSDEPISQPSKQPSPRLQRAMGSLCGLRREHDEDSIVREAPPPPPPEEDSDGELPTFQIFRGSW